MGRVTDINNYNLPYNLRHVSDVVGIAVFFCRFRLSLAIDHNALTSTSPLWSARKRLAGRGKSAVWRKALTPILKLRRRSDGRQTRSIGAAPIGLVVLVAIVCVVVSVLSAAQRSDDVELAQERKLLTHAIIDRGRRVLRELENVAASNDI